MNDQQKKEPKEPLHIPLDFKETVADMLKVKPPPKEPAAAKKKPKKAKK
jgi:hypothetical protein